MGSDPRRLVGVLVRAPARSGPRGALAFVTISLPIFIDEPSPSFLMATISATMLNAISSGERPPRFSPTGDGFVRCAPRGIPLEEGLVDEHRLALAAEEADKPALDCAAAMSEVVFFVAARSNDDVMVEPHLDRPQACVEVVDDDAIGVREALLVGEQRAVVDDEHPEAHELREGVERLADVSAASDHQSGRGGEALDEYLAVVTSSQRLRPRGINSTAAALAWASRLTCPESRWLRRWRG